MTATAIAAREGKYLTFNLNGERYGVEGLRVVAIFGMQACMPLPQAPGFVKGLTLVRGKVLPVVDARIRLGMQPGQDTDTTCIILLAVGAGETGIIVDMIQDIVEVYEEMFDSYGEDVDNDAILGIVKLDAQVVTLLNIDAITRLS